MKLALILTVHLALLLAGCTLIALAICGLENMGLPLGAGPVVSFLVAMPWGGFVFLRAFDKIEEARDHA